MEIKSIASTAVTAQVEYTTETGKKITVSHVDLKPVTLSKMSIAQLEIISDIKEITSRNSCQNCKFWNALIVRNMGKTSFPVQGECRFNPPVVTFNDSFHKVETSFPEVSPYEWCGKWEAIPSQVPDVQPVDVQPAIQPVVAVTP
jgi:hypothetical protein